MSAALEHERSTPNAACALCGAVDGGSLCIAAMLREAIRRLGAIHECLLGPTEFAPPTQPDAADLAPADDLGLGEARAGGPDMRVKRRRNGVGLWEWRRVRPSYVRAATTLNVGTHDHDGRRPRVWLTASELRRVRAWHAAPAPAVASLEALVVEKEPTISGPLIAPPEAVLPPTGDDGGERPHAGTVRAGGVEYVRGSGVPRETCSDWPDGKSRVRYPNSRNYLAISRKLEVGRIKKNAASGKLDLWVTPGKGGEGDVIRAEACRQDAARRKRTKMRRQIRIDEARVREENEAKRRAVSESS